MSRKFNLFGEQKRDNLTSNSSSILESEPSECSDIVTDPGFLNLSTEQGGNQSNLNPGLVLTQSSSDHPVKVNLNVCSKIILSDLNENLTEKICLQLLYMIQQRYLGNRFILPVVVYSAGSSLCHLESYGQGSYLGTNNSTISYNLNVNTPPSWFASSNLDFDFISPGYDFRVALTYEVNPSMFKGQEFPTCIPEWMKPVFQASKSYRVMGDHKHGFYIV